MRSTSNVEAILSLSDNVRNCKAILVEKRLRATPLWKEIYQREGKVLALSNDVLVVINCRWSIQNLYGVNEKYREPLKIKEFSCAAEMMSGPFTVASLDEMKSRKKSRKLKKKELEAEKKLPFNKGKLFLERTL